MTRHAPTLATLALAAMLLPAGRAAAWGDNGHLLITEAAFLRLPSGCLRTFYSANGMALLQASLDPDAWRDTDPNEGPRHYLDIDVAGNPAGYPRDLATSLMLYGAGNGTVPWVVEAVYQQLVDAFVAQNVNNAVGLSGYLSHYSSDAHSPYHTTINYDGQNTGNPGIHGRYESDMIDANFTTVQMQLAMRTTVVQPPADVSNAIHDALQSGWPLNAGINATDRAARGNISTLWSQQGSAAVDRMALGASLIASLWQAAYAAAGTPRLAGMPASCGPSTPPVDAGLRDTGPGTPDSGIHPDAATSPDGGALDGGASPEAGPQADADTTPDADPPGPGEDARPAPDADDTVDAGTSSEDAANGAPDAGSASNPLGGANRSEGCQAIGGSSAFAWACVLAVFGLRRRRARA